MTTNDVPASGAQYTIVHGQYTATVASVGASLRTLEHAGRPLINPFDADEVRPGYRGAVLVPWPNRVVDGHYYVGGRGHVLAVTEPERGHALHGLACWLDWTAEDVTESSVVLGCTIQPQAGYPFRVHVTARYELSDAGLAWTVTATNVGTGTAPYGTGPHPYLIAGEGPADDWALTLPADRVLTVTPDRLVPTGVRPVAEYDGGSLDFREPRAVGSTFIDHAFTGVRRDDAGTATVELRAPSGSGVAMSWDSSCPWVQVHTPEAPGPRAWRESVAVEPMTCPPDAFNSGTDLIFLAPGDAHTTRWVIAAL